MHRKAKTLNFVPVNKHNLKVSRSYTIYMYYMLWLCMVATNDMHDCIKQDNSTLISMQSGAYLAIVSFSVICFYFCSVYINETPSRQWLANAMNGMYSEQHT